MSPGASRVRSSWGNPSSFTPANGLEARSGWLSLSRCVRTDWPSPTKAPGSCGSSLGYVDGPALLQSLFRGGDVIKSLIPLRRAMSVARGWVIMDQLHAGQRHGYSDLTDAPSVG